MLVPSFLLPISVSDETLTKIIDLSKTNNGDGPRRYWGLIIVGYDKNQADKFPDYYWCMNSSTEASKLGMWQSFDAREDEDPYVFLTYGFAQYKLSELQNCNPDKFLAIAIWVHPNWHEAPILQDENLTKFCQREYCTS
jgi:hypothetical protein